MARQTHRLGSLGAGRGQTKAGVWQWLGLTASRNRTDVLTESPLRHQVRTLPRALRRAAIRGDRLDFIAVAN
jgi:hypothetical protein